jgi:hypothetical protein
MVWFKARYAQPVDGSLVLLKVMKKAGLRADPDSNRERAQVRKATYDAASDSFLVRRTGQVVPSGDAEWTLYVPYLIRLLFF